jgi:hypothetical protein
MRELKLETGTVVDVNYFESDDQKDSFIVIEEGLLSKRRVVDLTEYQGEDWAVAIPTGTKAMKVGTYRSKSMCPTPCLSEYVSYPFTLVVKETVVGYHLKVNDMTSMLSTVQMQRIRDQFREEPNDQQVVKMWVAEHQAKHEHSNRKVPADSPV